MANNRWRGDAPIVREVYTLVPGGTIEADDVFNVTIGNQIASTVAGSTVAATVATNIKATIDALAAITDLYGEITWSINSATITATGPSDGRPVTVAGATTETGGGAADDQTFTVTNTVNGEGPEHWGTIENWTAGNVPASDVVFIENFSGDIKWDLDQSSADITSLNVYASMTGDIGLPDQSEEADYFEYRQTYLHHQTCTTYNIGEGEGRGSGRLRFNASAAQTTVNVWKTGTRKDPGIPSLLWKGTHASNVVNLHRGDMGIAFLPGETATVLTARVGFVSNVTSDAKAWFGSGVTLTTLVQTGGQVWLNCAATTITMAAGTLTSYAGAVTTINARNCTVVWNSTATITTYNGDSDSVLDAEQDERAFTITNCTLKKGAVIKNRKRRITFTNGIILDGCSLEDVTVDCGDDITLAVTYN